MEEMCGSGNQNGNGSSGVMEQILVVLMVLVVEVQEVRGLHIQVQEMEELVDCMVVEVEED
jgi:hypothetical protein